MKFKLDEKGHIVTQDGKPVVIKDDETETVYDVLGKIAELNAENADRRNENKKLKTSLKEAQDSLEAFSGLGSAKEIRKLSTVFKSEPFSVVKTEPLFRVF